MPMSISVLSDPNSLSIMAEKNYSSHVFGGFSYNVDYSVSSQSNLWSLCRAFAKQSNIATAIN